MKYLGKHRKPWQIAVIAFFPSDQEAYIPCRPLIWNQCFQLPYHCFITRVDHPCIDVSYVLYAWCTCKSHYSCNLNFRIDFRRFFRALGCKHAMFWQWWLSWKILDHSLSSGLCHPVRLDRWRISHQYLHWKVERSRTKSTVKKKQYSSVANIHFFRSGGGGGAKPPKFSAKPSNFWQSPPPHLHLKRLFLASFGQNVRKFSNFP